MSKVDLVRIGKFRIQVHQHDWTNWREDVAIYGNVFGHSHDEQVRVRQCTDCLKYEVKRLTED